MQRTRSIRFFHVIGQAAGSHKQFARTADYRAFISTLRSTLGGRPIRLLAYAILPNQWHLVVGSVDPVTTLELIAGVARTHAMRHARTGVMDSHVGVERLHGASMIVTRCRDVEREALGLGLVSRAQDWPWCSTAERFLMLDRLPLVVSPFLVSPLWLDYLNDPDRQQHVRHQPLRHLAEMPGGLSGVLKRRQQRIRLGRRADKDHPDAHVESAEHLRLGHASGLP
jgi:hypothetical protein